ncbi:MAG: hypothetical protein RMA76_13585 [Deltaproteobacteria bacterium]
MPASRRPWTMALSAVLLTAACASARPPAPPPKGRGWRALHQGFFALDHRTLNDTHTTIAKRSLREVHRDDEHQGSTLLPGDVVTKTKLEEVAKAEAERAVKP